MRSPAAETGVTRVFVVVAVLLLAVLATAPRVPYAWDAAATWIERADREREAPGTLLANMQARADWALLMPISGLHVYPVGHPMIAGLLARPLPPEVSTKRAADLLLGALLVLLLWRLRQALGTGATVADVLPALLVFACPFVVVHLRIGYVDIVVGVLGALAAVCAVSALRAPTMARWCAWVVVGSLLCQTKQDGAVLLAAGSITATWLAAWRGIWSWKAVAVQLLVPMVNVGGWWLLTRWLFGPDMPPATRFAVGVDLAHAQGFAYETARHLLDVDTWGWTWGVLLGMAVVRHNPWWVMHVAMALGIYATAHIVGPAQMLDYLAQGTVMNRLLLQVLVASLPFALPLAHGGVPGALSAHTDDV